jgi:hypothetical protein
VRTYLLRCVTGSLGLGARATAARSGTTDVAPLLTRRVLPSLLILVSCHARAAGPSVLSNTDHYSATVPAVISALGGSTSLSITDQTCPSGGAGWNYGSGSTCGTSGSNVPTGIIFPEYALGVPGSTITNEGPANTVEFYSFDSATEVAAEQPYGVITESFGGYTVDVDQQVYPLVEANGIAYNMPYCPLTTQTGDYPPIAMITELPHGATCFESAGSNGLEFSLPYVSSGSPANYPGVDGTPSSSGAAMAATLAVMKQNHPTWTWGDVKAALRITASNWATGYAINNSGALGYGDVHWAAANAISSPTNIYLQPPGMTIVFMGANANITLYPFLQTRRVDEVVYKGGTWPSPATGCSGTTCNEYTAAQIAGAGGTLVYSSGGSSGPIPHTYTASTTETDTFIALTLDSSGNGSRVESFMPITGTLNVYMPLPPVIISGQQTAIIMSILTPLLL